MCVVPPPLGFGFLFLLSQVFILFYLMGVVNKKTAFKTFLL